MKIIYNKHAEVKIKEREIDKGIVESTIVSPDRGVIGFHGRTIFEKKINEKHKIRVICEIKGENIKVISCYITKVGRYENRL
ncbi:MAG: DUF4258 domain-containing protein [Euryarchaeota archaeon]|nr:DUF4258 domain-containing protein [Euryarchaeota archaeon]